MNVTPCPMKTLSSMITPSQINVWLEILQRLPTDGILLDFDEGSDFGFIADFASVEVDELGEFDVLPKLYIWRDAYVWICGHWLFVKEMLLVRCEGSGSIGFGSFSLGFVAPDCIRASRSEKR